MVRKTLLVFLFAVSVFLMSAGVAAGTGGGLRVTFIDVGQGDSIFIVCDDVIMLIDAGESQYADKIIGVIEAQGYSRIDFLVSTHPHADHIGGMTAVINTLEIGEILMPEVAHTTLTFERLLDAIIAKDIDVRAPEFGEQFWIGGAVVTVLAPEANENHLNNSSICIKIEYGGHAFLFMGDAEIEVETLILASEIDVSSSVLKVGHHGSNTSSSELFLRAVMPQIAIISVGASNNYGHPTTAVLNRLSAVGAAVYRTDTHGTIVVTVNDHGDLSIETEKTVTPTPVPAIRPAATPLPMPTTAAQHASGSFIGNNNSLIFHRTTCNTLPAEQNRIYFDSRQAAVDYGMRACQRCKP